MAYQKQIDPALPIVHATCVHLRSKEMYVTGKRDPDHPDEASHHFCWCNLTQHKLGPDSQAVARAQCSPERDCYRETY
ncbi:MAG: hypothetical protein KDA41_10680 [Planctomycetales bacterium]|nr:hypothetical protein [Planctomycetales bacterium]